MKPLVRPRRSVRWCNTCNARERVFEGGACTVCGQGSTKAIQRELPLDGQPRTYFFLNRDGKRRSLFYTVSRRIWVQVRQEIDGPATVAVCNQVEAPNREVIIPIRDFPTGDEGWEQANRFVRELIVALGLVDRTDNEIDHLITVAYASLAEASQEGA